jgi:Uma2 family endonuclease
MGTVTTLPRGQALTRRDLEKMPDDGHRYELIDGTLIVTPAPSLRHQLVSSRLQRILTEACPDTHVVLSAPVNMELLDDTVLQPDLLVVPLAQVQREQRQLAATLVVEIVSPSTRLADLTLKRARCEAGGCPAYWVVDPDGPSLTVWELEEGEYVERADVVGDEACDATAPFAVTVVPSRLLD